MAICPQRLQKILAMQYHSCSIICFSITFIEKKFGSKYARSLVIICNNQKPWDGLIFNHTLPTMSNDRFMIIKIHVHLLMDGYSVFNTLHQNKFFFCSIYLFCAILCCIFFIYSSMSFLYPISYLPSLCLTSLC